MTIKISSTQLATFPAKLPEDGIQMHLEETEMPENLTSTTVRIHHENMPI